MDFTPFHHYPSRRSAVMARNIVSTSHPLAAQAGLAMLSRGGNAVDAALAAAITLSVVEPTGNGLGSDNFGIVWDGQELHGLNASGRAPTAWTPDRFRGRERIPYRGWESVTVPGAVSGWVAMSQRFGKLPFEALFEFAIDYAERGFGVSPIIAAVWASSTAELEDQPGFRETFMPGGRAPRAGETFRNPAMAKSLRLIAKTNGKAFYEGELARAMTAHAQDHGAALSMADLAAHKADWCGTISQDFADVSLHEIPPNGQGIAALMALGILAHTEIANLKADDPRGVHLMIEAVKLALSDVEHFVSDLNHMKDITSDDLLSPAYLKQRALLIDADTATDFKTGDPKSGGTVYVTAADATGMMVSFIQSNYAGFGSGVVVPETGIHMQNRGAAFSLDPKSQNVVAPGKRPFHTIIPAFLMQQGRPLMSFGVMGGPMQAQGHVQMVVRTQLWGQDPQMAIDAPRWRTMGGLEVACEASMDATLIDALTRMGHQMHMQELDKAFGFGGAQIITRLDDGTYAAGSDPRKDGQAVGF